MGLVSIGFLSFMLMTSNPFERLFPAPLEGRDLNPLLQDPGLAVHPPMLYMGYVGLSVAFSFRHRRIDRRAPGCGLGTLVAALDADRLDVPHHRHHAGQLVVLQ